MNKSVAIVVALVVIVAAGTAAYLGLRKPETETLAGPAAVTTEPAPAAGGSGETPSAPAAATTADAAATGGSTAPATTGTTTAAGSTAPAATATTTAQANAQQPAVRPDDHVLGSADAPVTIIEYASMTCPHCAAFHAEAMPKLKSEFIDKGQVRLVFRPFPLNQLALRASLLAECVPADQYFGLLETMFAGQREWMEAQNPLESLHAIGKTAGIEESKIDACMTDEAATNRIAANYKEAFEVYGVNSTPSFIINGTKYAGALPFDDLTSGGTPVKGLSSIVRELLPK